MKKSFVTRFLSVVLVIMTFLVSAISTQAASHTAFNQLSNSKPMKTYILSTSNIPCYTSSSLKTRGTVTDGKSSTAYIAPSDDIYVVSVDTKLKWAKVTYPVGSKRYTAFIALSKITSNNGNHKKTTATSKVMTYKRSNSSTGSNSMYISKGESVYLIATYGSYCQVMYPCSGGWRLAWVTKTNYDKYLGGSSKHVHNYSIGYEAVHPHRIYKKCTCGAYYYTGETKKISSCTICYPTVGGKIQYPMRDYVQTVSWGQRVSYMGASRNAHLAIDLCPRGDDNVYSIATGTVKRTGYNRANGNYVIIQHTISNKTVYSFYAHLKSVNTSVGTKVNPGTKIGVVGQSGSGGNGVTHLHFAIVDYCSSSGGYYGYGSAFSGNKTVYDGMTFYNPTYVIKNGKLPS